MATVAASPAARTRRPASPVRLTRRGRVVVFVLLLAASFALLSLGRAFSSAASTSAPVGPVADTIVVAPGQTLWQIAESVEPGADPRATIERLRELNDLGTGGITAGQQLLVPAHG